MISFSKFLKERRFSQVVALVLLLLLLAVGAIPGYLTGRWQWHDPPRVISLNQLRQIRQKGLTLPGWQTIEQREQEIGARKWSYQLIQKKASKLKLSCFCCHKMVQEINPKWSGRRLTATGNGSPLNIALLNLLLNNH